MKKIFSIILCIQACVCLGQRSNVLIRHDTTLLNANECQWLLPKDMAGRTVPALLLDAIFDGRLKAIDPQSNEVIPASKIFTWRQSTDSVMVWDEKKQQNLVRVIQQEIKSDHITRIKVYHDWVVDIVTGKLEPIIKYVELMQDIYSVDGVFRGYRAFCRLE